MGRIGKKEHVAFVMYCPEFEWRELKNEKLN
jgi:hypothetical protein